MSTASDAPRNIEPQYSILSGLAILLLGLALLTLIPHAASAPDLVGFHTLCSFAPLSTLILAGVAGFVRAMRNTLYRRRPRR